MEILFEIIISIFIFGLSIINIYIGIKYAVHKSRKENMSKIDFSGSKNYYREILKNYSAAELSYIDDFKINPKREIVSTILNLKLKNKIEIEKDGIIILDNNEENLKKTEKFILRNIQNRKVKIDNSGYIESFAQDEAIEDELITKNTNGKKRIKRMLIRTGLIFIISFILFSIFCNNVEMMNNINTMYSIFILLFFVIIMFTVVVILPIVVLVYSLMQINSYERTEKGEEINKNIEGLKKYINDYSLLNSKDVNQLAIWEEYLIYSVIFDFNSTNIVEQIFKFVEIEYGIGKNI